jgi:hypothetical protein
MSNANPFVGQFPLTAPDLVVNQSAGGMLVDMDALATETTTEAQNLQQDLTNRLVEMPGSNLDFGTPNVRGIGIMMYLSGTSAQLVGLPGRIDAEFVLDPRVTSSYTTLTKRADGSYLIASQVETVSGVTGLSWGWSQAGLFPSD